MDKTKVIELLAMKEVIELTDVHKVNSYIDLGWELMGISAGEQGDGQAYMLYSLGWRKPRSVAHPSGC